MNTKQKRRLCGTALRKRQLQTAYRALTFLQAPFALVFWLTEQQRARLQDRIDNEEDDR